MKVCLLLTSCNRAAEIVEATRANLEVLGSAALPVIIADCSTPGLNYTQVHAQPNAGGINSWIPPESFDTDYHKLEALNPVALLHVDWIQKQAGDMALTNLGLQEARRLGFEVVIKLSGSHRIKKNVLPIAQETRGIRTKVFHDRKYAESGLFIIHDSAFDLFANPDMAVVRGPDLLYAESRLYRFGNAALEDWPDFLDYYNYRAARAWDWSCVADQLPTVLHLLEHIIGGDMRGDVLWLAEQLKAANPRNVLELGVRDGVSTLAFLVALKESANPAPMDSVDIVENPECTRRIQTLGLAGNWTFIKEDDREFRKGCRAGIDFIFLDTSHEYKHTVWELENYCPLLSEHGRMICHDVKSHPAVRQALDEFAAAHPEFDVNYRLDPSQCGMGIVTRKARTVTTTEDTKMQNAECRAQSAEVKDLKRPLVSCLTATAGRFSVLREALGCFLAQDYEPREMIILNNHPTPIVPEGNPPKWTDGSYQVELGGAGVLLRIYNEPKYATLGDCRNRLLELARGEYVRTWDDDDLYLPWAISQGVEIIKTAHAHGNFNTAAKPSRSWAWRVDKDEWSLDDNVFEAAMTVETFVARRYGYKPGGGDEHFPLLDGIQREGGCRLVDVGWRASYVYRWGTNLQRISGTLGLKDAEGKERTLADRTAEWVEKNQDDGAGQVLTPADIRPYILAFARASAEKFPENKAEIFRMPGIPAEIRTPPEELRIPGMAEPAKLVSPGENRSNPSTQSKPSTDVVVIADCCGVTGSYLYVRVKGQWHHLSWVHCDQKKGAIHVSSDPAKACHNCGHLFSGETPARRYHPGAQKWMDKHIKALP